MSSDPTPNRARKRSAPSERDWGISPILQPFLQSASGRFSALVAPRKRLVHAFTASRSGRATGLPPNDGIPPVRLRSVEAKTILSHETRSRHGGIVTGGGKKKETVVEMIGVLHMTGADMPTSDRVETCHHRPMTTQQPKGQEGFLVAVKENGHRERKKKGRGQTKVWKTREEESTRKR